MPTNRIKKSLLKLPRSIKRSLAIYCDLSITGLSVWIAFGLRLDQWQIFQEGQWWALVAAIFISTPLFIFFGVYKTIFRYIGSTALLVIWRVFICYFSLFFCLFTIIGVPNVPRSIGVIQPILLFIGIGASRYFVRYWLGSIHNKHETFKRPQSTALIYGAGSAGRQLAIGLSGNKEVLVKGFIDDNLSLQGSTLNGVPVYSSANLQSLISFLGIKDIFLAMPSVAQVRRDKIIASLDGFGVRVRILPGLIDLASGRVRSSDLHNLDMNNLLGREIVSPDTSLLEKNIRNHVVLVTGAGGSIGSELCRQIIRYSPKSLILLDTSEHSLYLIQEELKSTMIASQIDILAMDLNDEASLINSDLPIKLVPCLASVREYDQLLKLLRAHKPTTVFHTAAYKHVPLLEQNPVEGIRNNVFGTLACVQASLDCSVTNFILVSTDKAVRPTNIMGASKRIAELILQAADNAFKNNHQTIFSMVRFGNVLGSSGSVIPLFSAQIAAGGPITLTHPEVTRYFMTIPEAAQLVIQASSMATGGDVFLLDMGHPVRIYDLATRMVYLSGLLVKNEACQHGDIEIKVTGLRPGEKLYEELLISDSPQSTAHPKIMKAHEQFFSWDDLQQDLERLKLAIDGDDDRLIDSILKKLVPGYRPADDRVYWNRENTKL